MKRDYGLSTVHCYLPEIVQDIVDVIGYASTEALLRAIGGTTFAFGRGVKDTPRLQILIKAIGAAKTYQLLAVFGGSEEYIPRCDKALKMLRNIRFKEDYLQLKLAGKSATMAIMELCPKYGITDRTGWDIIRIESLSKQQDLF